MAIGWRIFSGTEFAQTFQERVAYALGAARAFALAGALYELGRASFPTFSVELQARILLENPRNLRREEPD